MADAQRSVRLAAVGDLHCTKTARGTLQPLFSQLADRADVLLLCGDLIDYGLPEEAHILVAEMTAALKIPVIAVLGNHEYESGKADEVRSILTNAGIIVLDGSACEVNGIGFAGVKGFAGGFGERALQPWGEESIKRFVREAVDEAVKLESALASLRTGQRVTGPKTDLWLVKTVGVLIAVIGGVLIVAGWRSPMPLEALLLAVGSALALTGIDVVYVARGRIATIYLWDALAELVLVASWIVVGSRGGVLERVGWGWG